MIKPSELKRIAVKEGVPQGVVEKDVALSVALKTLANSKLGKHVAFKGGTAIRKIYFEEARFSDDLDFNVIRLAKSECLKLLKEALENKSIDGIDFGKVEEEKTTAGLKAAVKFIGPLAYAQRIRFDFNFRENFAQTPTRTALIGAYGISRAEISVLSIEEIFAEKLHALSSRSAPRDLYDVWFLFGKGVKIEKSVLVKKFEYYHEKFDITKALANARKSEQNWKRDLRHLLQNLPDFATIEREVKANLRRIS